jgi:hypothetical protein
MISKGGAMYSRTLLFVIPKRVAIRLGSSGNWPGQRQDSWKYIEASSPHRKFNQVLRPESHATGVLALFGACM